MVHEHGRNRIQSNDPGTPAESIRDAIELLKMALAEILQDRPVAIAYLYGSTTSGETTPFSDIDIALVLKPDCDLDPYGRLMLELDLEAELERCCGIANADIRSIDAAPLRVQGKVLIEGILLYCADDDFRVAYETQTRKSYFDFQPVLAMMRQARFARMEEELKAKGLYD